MKINKTFIAAVLSSSLLLSVANATWTTGIWGNVGISHDASGSSSGSAPSGFDDLADGQAVLNCLTGIDFFSWSGERVDWQYWNYSIGQGQSIGTSCSKGYSGISNIANCQVSMTVDSASANVTVFAEDQDL